MHFVDFDKVQANSGDDMELLHELIHMGLDRIDASLDEMHASINNQDWDGLSRTIHKLRPILCYAGIDAFNSELIELEISASGRSDLDILPGRIGKIMENLQAARCELEHLLSKLHK